MQGVDESVLKRIQSFHKSGARILLRRTHDRGHIKIKKGPFQLLTERHSVDLVTYEAVKRIIGGEGIEALLNEFAAAA